MINNSVIERKKMSRRRDTHSDSKLLTSEENRKIQELLGAKVISKSTAVARLYTSNHTGQWEYIITGVVCLTKDSNRRSYFIQGA